MAILLGQCRARRQSPPRTLRRSDCLSSGSIYPSNPNHLHNMMQLRVKIRGKIQLLFCWKVAALTALNVHELTHGFWQQEAFQASEVPFCLRAAAMDIFLLKSVQTKVQQLNAARFLRHQRKQIPRLKRF